MKEENDPIKQIEQFKLIIKEKSIIHQSLLEYFGISDYEINQKTHKEGKTEEIFQILKESNIPTNKCEFKEFLEAISHLWKMHQSSKEIKYKIEKLIIILKKDIKNTFSEKEIFSVFGFCSCNYTLLILLEQNIISMDIIIQNINRKEYKHWDVVEYFYPEIRKYDEKYLNQLMIKDRRYGLKQFVEEHDQNLESFNAIRKGRIKESKIIELIREDKIDEFISFVEHFPIDLNKKISKEETIFRKKTEELAPIEYSALFGSAAIFRYLYLKNVSINIITEGYNSNIS